MPMSPESLRLLHLIGEAGALTGAADELGLSTPAVSQQLARLEDDLDLSLVDRGPRGARLTPAGRVLAAHGRLIDEETHRAADSLAGLRGQHLERLRIGAIHAAAQALATGNQPMGFVRAVTDRIIPSIVALTSKPGALEIVDENQLRTEHVKNTVEMLHSYSTLIANAVIEGRLAIIGLEYDLEDGQAHLINSIGNIEL